MKKLITLALVLVLTLSMATTAFAWEATEVTKEVTATTDNGTQEEGQAYANSWTIDVPAGITLTEELDKDKIEANYYVIVNWTVNSTLTYAADEKCYSWNVYDETGAPADATGNAASAGYESTGAVWMGKATVKVDVTNWSNRAMTATLTLAGAAANEDNGIQTAVAFKDTLTQAVELKLANAAANATLDGQTGGTADTQSYTYTIDCSAEDAANKDITAGEITQDNAVIGQVTVVLTETVTTTTDPQG